MKTHQKLEEELADRLLDTILTKLVGYTDEGPNEAQMKIFKRAIAQVCIIFTPGYVLAFPASSSFLEVPVGREVGNFCSPFYFYFSRN